MIWIFALGIIGLAVYNKGFRKVVLWIVGSVAAVVATIEIALALGIVH